MAQNREHRQPRHRELRSLIEGLPFALRVVDLEDRLLWQNRAAATLEPQTSWQGTPTTWQSRKARLQWPMVEESPEVTARISELEAELERARRQQRSTARRKKKAEQFAQKAEKELQAEVRRRERGTNQALAQASRDPEIEALRVENSELRESLSKLESKHQAYRQQVEEANAERELEAQLRQKVEEFEELERAFEAEQEAFRRQKTELEKVLSAQELELNQLQGQLEPEATAEAVMVVSDELALLREQLHESLENGRALGAKLELLEEAKLEQLELLKLLREDLSETRQRERELRETLKLYADLRQDLDQARTDGEAMRRELEELRLRERDLQGELERSKRSFADQGRSVSGGSNLAPGVSEKAGPNPLKSQVDLLQSRLRETEKQLDAARKMLKEQQTQAQGVRETEKLAFQDLLTGLPNRHIIARYLDFAGQQLQSAGHHLALFLIDIDAFRVLVQALGRARSDELLRAVGQRLNGMRGPNHVVARCREDRFILLAADLPPQGLSKFVKEASESLLQAVAFPFEVDGEKLGVTASVGVVTAATVPSGGFPELYGKAEAALRKAKVLKAGSALIYDDSLQRELETEIQYRRQMSHALERQEFFPVFQPVLDLKTSKVASVELLLRWRHRDGEILGPDKFLAAALDSGAILPIAASVWPQALDGLGRWRRRIPKLTLSINLSARELLSPDLISKAKMALQSASLPPEALIFEVRDGSKLRVSSTWWQVLAALTKAGFGLCLDDFGRDSSLFGTLGYQGFGLAKVSVDERALWCPKVPGSGSSVAFCAKRVQKKLDQKGLLRAGFTLAQGFAVSLPLEEFEVDELLK